MEAFKIARFDGNKKAIARSISTPNNLFVPESLRAVAEIGSWVLVNKVTIKNSARLNADGSRFADENGKPVFDGPGFDRFEIGFVGTKAEVQEMINDSYISSEVVEKMQALSAAKMLKEYEVEGVNAAELVG